MTTRSVPARVHRVEAGWIWIKDYRGMDITFTLNTLDDLIRELTEISDRQKGERAWWTRPCEYGHEECSFRWDGPCGDEHNHPDPDLEWREPLGGQEMP